MKQAMIREKHPKAMAAIQRYAELRQYRTDFERMWERIAELIRPQRGGFGLDSPTLRKMQQPLSSVPTIAHGHFAAGIYAGITNPATRWAGLTTPDEDLNRWPPFAEWLDRQTRKVHNSFSPSRSSFYPATYQAYADIAAFGNAGGYDEIDMAERRFIDVTISLAELVVDIDHHGRVCEVVRKFRLSPSQAARMFGKDVLPKAVQESLDKGNASDKHVYYHHVSRNDDFTPGGLGPRGKRWVSRHVCEANECLLREGGYDEMPFYFPRWDVDTAQIYGTGPGFNALASATVHHRMHDATLRAAQRAADPVKLAPGRDVVPLDGTWRPGDTVYGAITPGGQRLVQTEDFNGANTGLTLEKLRNEEEKIKEAFYYSVMSLTGRTGISDDENRVIEEARLRNWAPHADRIMEEYGARKVERRYAMLMRAGQIDPVPEGVPGDAQLQIHYQSAAAQAAKASEANQVRRYLQDLLPLMQIKPELRHRLSADDYAEVLHDASPGLPQRLLVPREQAQEAVRQEQQMQMAQQAADMAQTGGAGLEHMARAAVQGQGGGDQ